MRHTSEDWLFSFLFHLAFGLFFLAMGIQIGIIFYGS